MATQNPDGSLQTFSITKYAVFLLLTQLKDIIELT